MTTTEYQTPTDRYDDAGDPNGHQPRRRGPSGTKTPDYKNSELQTEHTRHTIAAELQYRVEHYQQLAAETSGAEQMAARNQAALVGRVVKELAA